MPKFIRTISVQLLVAFLTLAGIEIGVRVFVPDIQPTGTDTTLFADDKQSGRRILSPGASGYSHGYTFAVDSSGYWDYKGGASNESQILLIGDSVTMGIGVPMDSTVGGRLAENHTILNPSAIGFSSEDYERIIQEKFDASDSATSQIDRVIMLWCLNDVYETPVREGRRRSFSGDRIKAHIRRYYLTYHWLKAIATDRPRTYYEYDRSLYADIDSVQDAISRIKNINDVLSTNGIPLDFVIIPYEYQLRSKDRIPQTYLIDSLAGAIGNIHDPFDVFVGQTDIKSLYLYGDGIHLSTAGHWLLANYIESHVIALQQNSSNP